MPSETWPLRALLFLSALAMGTLGQQSGPAPTPATNSSAPCKVAFLRTYMLKGVARANSTDPFLICPSVTQNCCSKRDQLYIFHYLKTILPTHLNDLKMRRDSAFQRIRGLHRRILATSPNYTAVGVAKSNFCMTEWRKLTNFDMNKFNEQYIGITDSWMSQREESLSSFYCALCDATNHPFLDPIKPQVVIQEQTCTEFVKQHEPTMRFWLGNFMDFVMNFQNVVDCNHYTTAFNLTFFSPAKLAEREAGLSCLRTIGGALDPSCRTICSKMGVSSITPFVDGDPAFMEEIANFFEKSNFNQETGRFISMEMRHFFKRFEPIKQMNETEQGIFKNIVQQSLTPVVQSINVVELAKSRPVIPRKMTLQFLRDKLGNSHERRLESRSRRQPVPWMVLLNPMGPPAFHPSNRNSETIRGGYVEQANLGFRKELEHSPLLLNRRRLQATPATSNAPTSANSGKPRAPKIDIHYEYQFTYDQIGLEPRDPKINFVFQVQVTPLDFDKVPRIFSSEAGIQLQYTLMDLEMDDRSFYRLVYATRPPDQMNSKVDAIVEGTPRTLLKNVEKLLEINFDIDPTNYFVRSLAPNPERKLHLRGATASQLLKEITSKR